MSDNSPLAITAIGMASSLGDATTACAAARAGITRPRELALTFSVADNLEPLPLSGHACVHASGFYGYGKLAALCYTAINDLILSYPDCQFEDLAIIVNSPNPIQRPALNQQAFAQKTPGKNLFHQALLEVLPQPLQGAPIYIIEHGEAGLGKALQAVQQILGEQQAKKFLLLSADSFLEETTLETYVLDDRIQTPDLPNGFTPGEAACALMVEPIASTQQQPLASIYHVAVAKETYDFDLDLEDLLSMELSESDEAGTDSEEQEQDEVEEKEAEATPGIAYSQVINEAFQGVTNKNKPWKGFYNFNGELPKAYEWGQVLTRMTGDLSTLRELDWETPDLHFGHTGSASLAIAVCMAIRGASRGYLSNHNALICGTSNSGVRTALTLNLP